MKKIIRIFTVLSVVTLFAVTSSSAQIVVKARIGRPRDVVVVKPERPSPRHVWVSEEYAPSGNTYVYQKGYWAVPPQPGHVWVAGRWNSRRHGYVWIAGHWR